jgi:hypothetical protein
LDDAVLLSGQLDSVAVLFRFAYNACFPFLILDLQKRIETYEGLAALAIADRSEETVKPLELVETELAWIVNIVTCVVCNSANSYSRPNQMEDDVFKLIYYSIKILL